MIVSHKYRFIFLKTRKTAGTSIEIALSSFCGEKDIITTIPPEDEKIREELGYRGSQNFYIPSFMKYTIRDWGRLFIKRKSATYREHILAATLRSLIGREIWNSYFKFCFERNPWDRAVSLYYWRTHDMEPRPSLLEFLCSANAYALSNFEIYSINEDLAVDHVGFYEDLDSELERIAELLRLPEQIRLPKAKGNYRRDKRHYREIIGQKEKEIIAKICANEIKHFGYTF